MTGTMALNENKLRPGAISSIATVPTVLYTIAKYNNNNSSSIGRRKT
jgi:hypothetical protein